MGGVNNIVMKKRFESAEKPEKCPKCGAPVYRILYGLPAMSEEEYFNTYHEHVIYGGCCISEDDPEWQCSKCGAEIYNATHIPYTKKDAYAKLDAMLSEEDKKEMTTRVFASCFISTTCVLNGRKVMTQIL